MNSLDQITDTRVKKHVVAVSERGQLFVVTGAYRREQDKQRALGRFGLGFNGEQVMAEHAEFVAETINEYLEKTYGA